MKTILLSALLFLFGCVEQPPTTEIEETPRAVERCGETFYVNAENEMTIIPVELEKACPLDTSVIPAVKLPWTGIYWSAADHTCGFQTVGAERQIVEGTSDEQVLNPADYDDCH